MSFAATLAMSGGLRGGAAAPYRAGAALPQAPGAGPRSQRVVPADVYDRPDPPVPIAARTLGVYHRVERVGDEFRLSYVPSWWRVWQSDDRRFVAEPGDAVYVFFAIYAPTRFDDTVFVRWSFRDPTSTWQDSDRIPIRITGGRERGFRGVATKENYVAGAWRVIVETRDRREIARLRFRSRKPRRTRNGSSRPRSSSLTL